MEYDLIVGELDRLDPEYQECNHRMEKEQTICREQISREWKITNFTKEIMELMQDMINKKKISQNKNICCALWDIFDCFVDRAEHQCTEKGSFYLIDFEKQVNFKMYKAACESWPYNSAKCHFPLWGSVLSVIGGFVLIGILLLNWFYRIRERRAKKEEEENIKYDFNDYQY